MNWRHVDQDDTHHYDVGLTYAFSETTSLDVEVGAGVNHAADDWFVAVEFDWRLPWR